MSPARLARLVPHLREHDVFICGPDSFADDVRAALRTVGVPRRHIHHESFSF